MNRGLVGSRAVVPVVDEAGGSAAEDVAVRALDAGVAAALAQPVATRRVVDICGVAGVAGLHWRLPLIVITASVLVRATIPFGMPPPPLRVLL